MNIVANKLDSKHAFPNRSIVIIGMPGSGKSTIGRRLAAHLNLDFIDSDTEIEKAVGMKISQIFEQLGEPVFRQEERQVITRILKERPPLVLSTGGGAFMDESTRQIIREKGVSVWLRADIDVLVERTSRNNKRPLLKQGNPTETLCRLLAAREPLYALADITVTTGRKPVKETVERVLEALKNFVVEQK